MLKSRNVSAPTLNSCFSYKAPAFISSTTAGSNKVLISPKLLVSPSNAYYDLRQKKEIYEKYGVKEYIIIDPIAQNADLYILKDNVYHLHQRVQKTEQLNSVLLPGLAIDLQKIFK